MIMGGDGVTKEGRDGSKRGREGGRVTFPPLVESTIIAPPPFAAAKAR